MSDPAHVTSSASTRARPRGSAAARFESFADAILTPGWAAKLEDHALKQVLANLLSNAIKFTRNRNPAAVEVGCRTEADSPTVYFVGDNGAGFDMHHAD
jgi:two-component system sensor kinase